jgi:hypothetical protein
VWLSCARRNRTIVEKYLSYHNLRDGACDKAWCYTRKYLDSWEIIGYTWRVGRWLCYRNERCTHQDQSQAYAVIATDGVRLRTISSNNESYLRETNYYSHPTSPFLGTADTTVTFLPPTSFLGTADITVTFLLSSNLFSRNCRHNSYYLPMGWRSWQCGNLTAAE